MRGNVVAEGKHKCVEKDRNDTVEGAINQNLSSYSNEWSSRACSVVLFLLF